MDIIKRQNRKYEKSDFFFKLFDLLKSIYKDSTDISESEIELLAGDLGSSIESGYSIADINATVTNFWQILLWSREKRIAIVDAFDDNNTLDDEVFETEVDAELAKQLEIAEGIIDLLEVNEKQAHALYLSFVDECNLYNVFLALATDYREYLTPDELAEVFETAKCFDKKLVDCYRDD